MPLLYYLPLITAVSFIVSLALIIVSTKGKSIKYTVLYCFMLGTSLAISVIAAIIIYRYHGLNDLIILDKLPMFIMLIVASSLFCILKALLVKKEMANDKPDYGRATLKFSSIDSLSLGLLIVTIIIFKV